MRIAIQAFTVQQNQRVQLAQAEALLKKKELLISQLTSFISDFEGLDLRHRGSVYNEKVAVIQEALVFLNILERQGNLNGKGDLDGKGGIRTMTAIWKLRNFVGLINYNEGYKMPQKINLDDIKILIHALQKKESDKNLVWRLAFEDFTMPQNKEPINPCVVNFDVNLPKIDFSLLKYDPKKDRLEDIIKDLKALYDCLGNDKLHYGSKRDLRIENIQRALLKLGAIELQGNIDINGRLDGKIGKRVRAGLLNLGIFSNDCRSLDKDKIGKIIVLLEAKQASNKLAEAKPIFASKLKNLNFDLFFKLFIQAIASDNKDDIVKNLETLFTLKEKGLLPERIINDLKNVAAKLKAKSLNDYANQAERLILDIKLAEEAKVQDILATKNDPEFTEIASKLKDAIKRGNSKKIKIVFLEMVTFIRKNGITPQINYELRYIQSQMRQSIYQDINDISHRIGFFLADNNIPYTTYLDCLIDDLGQNITNIDKFITIFKDIGKNIDKIGETQWQAISRHLFAMETFLLQLDSQDSVQHKEYSEKLATAMHKFFLQDTYIARIKSQKPNDLTVRIFSEVFSFQMLIMFMAYKRTRVGGILYASSKARPINGDAQTMVRAGFDAYFKPYHLFWSETFALDKPLTNNLVNAINLTRDYISASLYDIKNAPNRAVNVAGKFLQAKNRDLLTSMIGEKKADLLFLKIFREASALATYNTGQILPGSHYRDNFYKAKRFAEMALALMEKLKINDQEVLAYLNFTKAFASLREEAVSQLAIATSENKDYNPNAEIKSIFERVPEYQFIKKIKARGINLEQILAFNKKALAVFYKEVNLIINGFA